MPSADVVVIGAGLSGLTAAVALTEHGARVALVAQGNGATHSSGGPIDVGVAPRIPTAAKAVRALAAVEGHPYAVLGPDVEPALTWFGGVLAAAGLPHRGGLDDPLRALPTGIGATRPVGVVPDGQAAALPPWASDERLVVVGPEGFKDFWPTAVAASLSRPAVWGDSPRPASVTGLTVELPGTAGRRNLNALILAGLFDGPTTRSGAIDALARSLDRAGGGPARVGIPAILGRDDHPAAMRETTERLGRPVFELPIVSPSIPGIRLYQALRRTFLERGGRLFIGEPVTRVEVKRRRVGAIATAAATREVVIRTGAVVLATGGLTGGGVVGEPDGRLRETVFGLAVEGPRIDDWLAGDPLDPSTLPIATAGIRTDAELRPIAVGRPKHGSPLDNVRVIGAALAGQRWLTERSGDGIAIASAWRAAASLAAAPERKSAGRRP